MGSKSQTVCTFPGVMIRSRAEWERYREQERSLIDARYRLEINVAGTGLPIRDLGVCAVCACVSAFRSDERGAETLANGIAVPDWREQQVCGCGQTLNCRNRASVHFMTTLLGPLKDRELLLFGNQPGTGSLLEYLGAVVRYLPASVLSDSQQTESGSRRLLDAIICEDIFDSMPSMDESLLRIFSMLVRGGALLFTSPFHINSDESRMEFSVNDTDQPRWHFGWDLLEQVRAAGFRDCAVVSYWSRELGYLGVNNLLFVARK